MLKTNCRTDAKRKLKIATAALVVATVCVFWPAQAFADDFGDIVHHIEARYHAHQNYRFLMAFAGFTAKMWHGTGVKDVKIAYFENQDLFQSDPDKELEEILRATGKSGWQPMVKSYSRRRAEQTFIYAQPAGKDLKLLVVNVERREAEVVEVRIDPDKLENFIDEHERHGHHVREEVM